MGAELNAEAGRDEPGSRLRIESLTKVYGASAAVRDLSLDVAPGEFCALVGPSGSGKTTTLMAVAGFVRPEAGRILLGGRDITSAPPHRRELGVVFQSYALFPHMTVADNIAFPLEVRKVRRRDARRRVAEMLELVHLTGYEHRRPRELSGGQQQRVALARALVHDPPLLLMDEPLGALDRKLREQMQVEIRRIQRRLGITALYVTHDRDEAMTMADRIAVMHDARLQQVGAPREIYERPATRFVAEFLGDANMIRARVASAGGSRCEAELAGGGRLAGLSFEARIGEDLTLAVRPERVRFCNGDVRPLLRGVVEDVIYRGVVIRYTVRVSGVDRPLQVERPNLGRDREMDPGEEVSMVWEAADVSVVGEGDG